MGLDHGQHGIARFIYNQERPQFGCLRPARRRDFIEAARAKHWPLVVLDRVAVAYAENQAAQQIQSQGFPVKPDVSIQGFPFLTQVLTRNLKDVHITAANVKEGPVTLSLVADATGADLDDLRELNPEMLRSVTPNDPNFGLNLPAGYGEKFSNVISQVPPDKWTSWRLHTVAQGETMADIARHYHVSVAAIESVGVPAHVRLSDSEPLIASAKPAASPQITAPGGETLAGSDQNPPSGIALAPHATRSPPSRIRRTSGCVFSSWRRSCTESSASR